MLWLLTVLGCAFLVWVTVKASNELRAFLLFATVVLVLSLVRPLAQPPAWRYLFGNGIGERYFLIPQLAVYSALVCTAWSRAVPIVRIGATALLIVAAVLAIPRDWSYRSFTQTGFATEARKFSHARPGTVWSFALNPPPFKMVLRKK
jgi:hypothetical protein